ncbi:MAG: hypothetical protein FWD00_00950 [Clostridiales bacterium]|nr:hypothetical protein [Clostridiales bacterium]
MKFKKIIILSVIILPLLAVAIIYGWGEMNMRPERALSDFSRQIERGNLSNINLRLYYSSIAFTPFPLSSDDLVDGWADYNIVIGGNKLEEHVELLNQIRDVVLIPVEGEVHLNARLYYIFETKDGHKIFDVAWGLGQTIFINGREFKGDDVFFDIAMLFLPEDEVKSLEHLRPSTLE